MPNYYDLTGKTASSTYGRLVQYGGNKFYDGYGNYIPLGEMGIGITGPTGPSGGPQGSQGPQGPDGIIGATGPIGNQGTQGNQGATGSVGTQGNSGATGPQGFQGSLGISGATGSQGPQGSNGNSGATGSQGTQGNQGPTGSIGAQGNQGTQGNQGISGTQGFQGTQGSQGIGITGSQGFQGNQGGFGPQGFQGTQGNQGVIGPTGSQGTQGVGITGSQGFQGPRGLQGAEGPAGSATSSAKSDPKTAIALASLVPSQIIKEYTFDHTLNKITFDSFSSIESVDIVIIINVTQNIIIYNEYDDSILGSASGNVLTLLEDTSSMDDSDDLLISYNNTVPFVVVLDDGLTQSYIGKSRDSGITYSDSKWRIQKVDLDTNVITYADGNDKFDNVWNDRVSLNYL